MCGRGVLRCRTKLEFLRRWHHLCEQYTYATSMLLYEFYSIYSAASCLIDPQDVFTRVFLSAIIIAEFVKLLQLHITAGAYSLRLFGPTLDDHASIMIEFCFRIRRSLFLPKNSQTLASLQRTSLVLPPRKQQCSSKVLN